MACGETCIYCGTCIDPAQGTGDHIIPVQLGEFRNDVRFRRICRACNTKIGASEQQFLRCGPESFFRDLVKPNVPAKRQRGRSQAKGAMGAPGPEFTFVNGDHHQVVRPSPDNPRNAFAVDQVVVRDDQGRERFFPLHPGMHLDQLRERLKKAGIVRITNAWLHCDQDRWGEYEKLLHGIYPNTRLQRLDPTEAGVHPGDLSIKLTVNDHYFRALAKIGFHYYLAHSRRPYRGDEDCFAPIRAFIMNGGKIDGFFGSSRRKFVMPFGVVASGGILSPTQWAHVLAADETCEEIIVYVQLFVGPGAIPPPHYIKLAKIPSRLLVESFFWGHVYHYDDPQVGTRYAGRVEESQFVRLNG